MRKLASVQVVSDITPIKGADRIELARVNGWDVVVKKGDFKPGDLGIYVEIDAFLPIRPEFEFLRGTSYKKMGDQEGFRLKTAVLRGQISQGLLLPVDVTASSAPLDIGEDVTESLGIVKYDPPVPPGLEGKWKGEFPGFIPKTDEERIQNLTDEYEDIKANGPYVRTEKLEGTSVTIYEYNGEVGACTRNTEWYDDPDFYVWRFAHEHGLIDKLKEVGGNIAIQGELIGPGIEGNIYKLHEPAIRFFNVIDINTRRKVPYTLFLDIMKKLDLRTIPILGFEVTLPETVDELIAMADGQSTLNPESAREGDVYRSVNGVHSFKVVSNAYLLQHG